MAIIYRYKIMFCVTKTFEFMTEKYLYVIVHKVKNDTLSSSNWLSEKYVSSS